MKPQILTHSLPAALLAAFGLTTAPAGAATVTWDSDGTTTSGPVDGTGDWLATGLWWDGAANVDWNNATPDNAVIGSGGAGDTITLGTVTAGTVLLDNFTGTYTLSGGSLDQSGGVTIGTTAGNVTISSLVSGAGGLTKKDAGTLTLSGANIFSGGLTVNADTLSASSDANTIAINTDMLVTGTGNRTPTLGGTNTGANTFAGIIPNAPSGTVVSLTKADAGKWILGGANSYSGGTTVSGGTLTINGLLADPLGVLPAAGGLVLTFRCLDAARRGSAVLKVQWSDDLGVADLWSANEAAVPEPPGGTVNGAVFVVTENGTEPTRNDVVATIRSAKAASGKLFGRLKEAETNRSRAATIFRS